MDASPTDCGSSRFRQEGAHEPTIDFMKQVTDKPVVGVGRFTSPDTMVSQVKRGILDLIGGARASIADPFLHKFDVFYLRSLFSPFSLCKGLVQLRRLYK